MQGDFWYVRYKPLPDELLSSWLVRLAWGNCVKLNTFCTNLWGRYPNIWTQDVDRLGSEKVLRSLSQHTGTSRQRAFQTTLGAYEGTLYERHVRRGVSKWIMPIGLYMRTRKRHGQQFCPACLAEDIQPYFRRQWRLAFVVLCSEHGNLLWDHCPGCGGAVSFHEGDYRKWNLDKACPMTRCTICGTDWRDVRAPEVWVPESLLALQKSLIALLSFGYGQVAGQILYSLLIFDGIHVLLRILQSEGYTSRLRRYLNREDASFEFGMWEKTNRRNFENFSVFDRAYMLLLLNRLLEKWPFDFVNACRNAGLSSSYFQSYHAEIPYWLFSVIDWYLNKTWYQPSDEEVQSCLLYLKKHGQAATANAIARTLGRTPSRRYYKPIF